MARAFSLKHTAFVLSIIKQTYIFGRMLFSGVEKDTETDTAKEKGTTSQNAV